VNFQMILKPYFLSFVNLKKSKLVFHSFIDFGFSY
jgi:hypothetical protein